MLFHHFNEHAGAQIWRGSRRGDLRNSETGSTCGAVRGTVVDRHPTLHGDADDFDTIPVFEANRRVRTVGHVVDDPVVGKINKAFRRFLCLYVFAAGDIDEGQSPRRHARQGIPAARAWHVSC